VGELRKWLYGAAGLLLVVSLVYSVRGYLQNNEYERRVRAAEQYADSVMAVAVAESARADALEAEADSLVEEVQAREDELNAEHVDLEEWIEEEAPDACDPFFEEYEHLLGKAERQRDDALGAFERQREAAAHLREAVDLQRARGDTLQAALDARPGPHNPLIPRLGVGLFVGVTGDGFVRMGVGVTLSWSWW